MYVYTSTRVYMRRFSRRTRARTYTHTHTLCLFLSRSPLFPSHPPRSPPLASTRLDSPCFFPSTRPLVFSLSAVATPFRRAVLSKQRERLCPLVPAVKSWAYFKFAAFYRIRYLSTGYTSKGRRFLSLRPPSHPSASFPLPPSTSFPVCAPDKTPRAGYKRYRRPIIAGMIFVGHRELLVVAHVRRSDVGALQAPISKIHTRFISFHLLSLPSIDIYNPFFLACRFNWTTLFFSSSCSLESCSLCLSSNLLPPSPSFFDHLHFFRSRLIIPFRVAPPSSR